MSARLEKLSKCNTVDTLKALFFDLTENEEVYNDAFHEVVNDSDKKKYVIKFLAEACDFISSTHKFGVDALPFGKVKTLIFLLKIFIT